MASQYSTILTSDSSTTVNQYDVIKYSDYESLKTKYDALFNKVCKPSQFYNLKVEGGGIIFFDWAYGFTGASTTGSSGCSVAADTTSDLGDYYYDVLSDTVKCTRIGSKHRFYVVGRLDSKGPTFAWDTAWDTVTNSTIQATSTDFGTGKANTTLLCNNITDTNSFWPTVKTTRATNPSGHTLVSDDSALDTRWFVPSSGEMYVLVAMQYSKSNYRPSGIPQLSIKYSASVYSPLTQGNGFTSRYWTSSNSTYDERGDEAFVGDMLNSEISSFSKSQLYEVLLCRTF